MRLLRALLTLPVVRFALVGLLNTLIDVLIFKGLIILGVHVLIAGAIGFFAGFLNGYFWNSRYVFYTGSRTSQVRYFVVSGVGLGMNEFFLYLFHTLLGLSDLSAKFIAVGIIFCWNYLMSKRWAFKE